MILTQWQERPTEIAYLLNPAFCGLVIREAVLGFRKESGQNLPFTFSYLILPLILHRPTRTLLPKSIACKLHSWVHANQNVLIGFHSRAKLLVPFTKEAIHWSMLSGILNISEDGGLYAPKKRTMKFPENSDPEFCIRKALFLGRWFTRSGEPSTTYAILGIRP